MVTDPDMCAYSRAAPLRRASITGTPDRSPDMRDPQALHTLPPGVTCITVARGAQEPGLANCLNRW